MTVADEGAVESEKSGGGVTVIVAMPDLVGSATEVAVRVTVGGLGTLGGAV